MVLLPRPVPERVAVSDAVVVGKVTGFGDKLVNAKDLYGDAKVDYQIAVVQVEDAVLGIKDVKEIMVGFVPPPPPPPPPPPGGPFLMVKRRAQFTLTLDQEGCLFLVKHPTEDFYVGVHYYDFTNKKDNPNFDKFLDEVKHAAQLLDDPAAGLQSKQADDRFLTAAMLIVRYKTRPLGAAARTEPIDAGQSKQILLALADADWEPQVGGPGFVGFQLNPQNVFFRLGLTAKDGWNQPKDIKELPQAAKAWLKDNADKYRIERFVAEKKDDK